MLSTGKPHTDIQSETWFDALLPASARPYTRLARLDRPIGAWLLFIPGLWSIWIAGGAGEFDANGVAILPTLLVVNPAVPCRCHCDARGGMCRK